MRFEASEDSIGPWWTVLEYFLSQMMTSVTHRTIADVELCEPSGADVAAVVHSSASSSTSSGTSSAAPAINDVATAGGKADFLEKVRQSNSACQSGDFKLAIQLYSEALGLDPANHVLHANRSAAYIKLGKFQLALQDAVKARKLNPKWPKAYYRQGVALQCLGRHADALASFSSGLAQDPKNPQLLAGLVEAAMKSPLRATLEPIYQQLQAMQLDKSPFVIISVIGQELLAAGHSTAAVVVLEAALTVGTCSLKLRGSVFSALSSAYWALNSLDKAVSYMQQDLAVAKSLGDVAGECRAHGNLGAAYFWKRNHRDSLTSHRYQLVLAMKCKDTQAAAMALTSLGHVYTAIGDYPNALASHKQCVQLLRPLGDRLQEAREIGHVGTVYLAMGELEKAVECHMEHLRIAKQLGNRVEEARAYSNLGSSHHYRRDLKPAIACHNHVLRIAMDIGDKVIEARAYAGLGHAARCMADYSQAKRWHEKQLDMALAMKDKVGEGRACSNLGIVYQLLGEHDAALKLHQAHLNVARALHDLAGMGRAYGNIGNACSAMGLEELAIKYHKQELAISKEVNDRSSEASTHGNLAVSYQALGMFDLALLHYRSHLNIARELKDSAGESCALLNLGNCHSSRADFAQAVPYYESHLMLSQEMHDVEGEAKACHVLGYAHYRLGNYKEAIRYYNQDLALARDLQDSTNIARAYCNLGLAHLALGNHQCALECQKHFLEIAQMMKHVQGMFRALGNIGDALMKIGNTDEAVQVYHKQLLLAKQSRDKGLEAGAYGALGVAHRLLGFHDKALGYHTQELTLRQELNDVRGECKAHGHLGAVHVALASYTYAMKCYEEQLERAHELKDSVLEAQAFGNLGITRLSMGHIEDAIGFFEQQLATLEQVPGNLALTDKGRGYANLGDCYDALCDFDEAVKCHEQYLSVALKVKNRKDQERAYRRLGNSNKCLGNLHQALVCFEKRLVVAHELDQPSSKATAYGDLGQVHTMMAQYGQAISCLEHQLTISKESGDRTAEADATCGLGIVYQQMGEHKRAMQYHRMDLRIAEETGNLAAQGRACGNLGVTHESLDDLETAIAYQEQHLSIAAQINDRIAKMSAFSSLGRIHHTMGSAAQSVAYLQQGLQIAEQLSRREDEAKIRHRLGLALWTHEDLEGAQQQLYRAADLLESIRRECRSSTDYKLSLFDLQTASYQALQRILVILGRHEEALVVAERSRTRAFVDLLLERQANGGGVGVGGGAAASQMTDSAPTSLERFLDTVNRQKATVLYFSMAAGFLYSWLIVPNKGVVKFHECNVSNVGEVPCGSDGDKEAENDCDSAAPVTADSHLAQYVQSVREALGVEALTSSSAKCGTAAGDPDNEVGDAWQQQHLEELGDKLNQEGDRFGFLRMVNRSHLLNGSNYSLSSLGSWNGSSSVTSSTRSRRPTPWPGPACIRELYDLLLAPVEDHLPVSGAQKELALILEGDLFLVPFPVLKGGVENEYLCERFDLLVAPSASVLRCGGGKRPKAPKTLPATVVAGGGGRTSGDEVTGLVVGNPRLPSSVVEQWGWGDIPYAEQEANCVADILGVRAVVGPEATKDAVLREISQVECVHLATHVSWKLSALVMSPGDVGDPANRVMSGQDNDVEGSEAASSTLELPSLSEFLLTAADILNMRLSAKLVVLSACHTRNHHGAVHADGIVGFVRSLLAAGAQCVLVSLWPVPDTAVKILMRTFYSSLLQGSRVSRSLSVAMENVRQHYPHPANWGGFVLVGCDVKLSSKVALMGQALCELLKTPDACRDALRVVLHLAEKSLQRIHRGQKNAMYTTQRSIEKKVGTADGWKDLLMSVGFRFEPAANSIPASVFFPQSDPGERLTQCSASLQALLGLSQTSLQALSKLLSSPEAADGIVTLLRQGSSQMCLTEVEAEGIEIPVNVKLWRVPGCHELLASLGFDLTDVGRDEVLLRTGKQASKRSFEFATQALLALFDTQEAPRSLALEESSSTESLERSSDEESNQGTPPLPRPTPDLFGLAQRAEGRGLKTTMGAFSAYVQAKNTRGEPDGRTTISNANGGGSGGGGPVLKGRDNDAFTPSPVEPVPKPQRETACVPAARSNLALSLSGLDLEENSIASCWESGLSTVRRQDKTEVVVDLGPQRPRRTAGFVPPVETTVPRLPPRNPLPADSPHSTTVTPYVSPYETVDLLGVTRMRPSMSAAEPETMPPPLPPPPIPGSRKMGGHLSVQEREDRGRFLTAQVNRLNRDPAIISDVYHDRNVGLGLAPPLSKLLFPNSNDVAAVTRSNKMDDGNVTGATTLPPPPPLPPPVPLKRVSASSLKHHQPQRDEGDGHSMTESTYGAWTPTGRRPKVDNIQSPGSSFTLYKPPPHGRGSKGFHETVVHQQEAAVDCARHKHHQDVATYVDKVLASGVKLPNEKEETRGSKQTPGNRNRVQRVVV